MDEEDGRPGPLAARIGQFDALMDALPTSLCLPRPFPISTHLSVTMEEGRGICPGMAPPPAWSPTSPRRPAGLTRSSNPQFDSSPARPFRHLPESISFRT